MPHACPCHLFLRMAEYKRLQAVNGGPGISAGAPALREEAATPSNASLALPGPTQAGMNGGFQFRAGQVGSQKVPACSCAYLATRHRLQSSRILCALARLGAQIWYMRNTLLRECNVGTHGYSSANEHTYFC